MPVWLRTVGPGVLIFGVTLLAYLPALQDDFIWNDSDYVTAPALRSVDGLHRIWTVPGATQQYYPLLHSAFWVQHRLWGDHPRGYHLVNLLLHADPAVLRIRPDSPDAHYQLGVALMETPGRQSEAPAHFEAALQLRPDFEPARQMLDRLRAALP